VQHQGGAARPGSRTRWRSARRTAAGSTRCRRWPRRCPCPCRCGSWSGRLPAVRASGCGICAPRGLVHREFAAGQQAHLGHRVQAALAVGVEGADAVDLVVEQVHPVGHQRAHGEQVDQAAAHRVFAGADHLGHVVVAGQRELRLQLGLVELLLDLELEGVAGQETTAAPAGTARWWRAPAPRRRRLRPCVAGCATAWPAARDQVLVRRKTVVGQGFPVGEQGAAQAGREERHFVEQALGVGGVGGDDGHRPARPLFAQASWASSRASAEPAGRGRAKRLPGVSLGRSMGAARKAKQIPRGGRRGVMWEILEWPSP
jgi:hypothetical protein